MGKLFAIVNQKGGVGKTTTAVNLSAALHELGLKTLLCDFDPQANATSGLGIEKRQIKRSVYDVILNGVDIRDAIVHTNFGDVLPSSSDLAGAAVELIGAERREYVLKDALAEVKDEEINLKEVFAFKEKGLTSGGEVNGSYIMYKYVPKVYSKIKSKGIDDIDDIFDSVK